MTRAIAPRSVGRNHKPPPPLFDPARATSPESEKALLAGLLDLLTSDASKCRDILAGVSGEMLTIDNGADVLRAISEAATLDAPRIGDVMASLRRQSSRRGDDYQCVVQLVTDLVEDTFATGPAAARLTADAAAEVRALLARRKAADACVDLLQALQSPLAQPADIGSIIDQLDAIRDAGDADGTTRKPTSLDIVAVLDAWARDEKEPLIQTLFSPLDRILGGGLPIGLTAIGAKPNEGKSCLGGQLTLGALEADRSLKAVWFRGEMDNSLLSTKFLATWSNLREPAIDVITRRDAGKRTPCARKVAVDMAQVIGERLTVVDPPLTPDNIEKHVAAIRPKLVVVDYLQLCECPEMPDRRAEIEHVTRRLARLATKYELAVIVISAIAKATSEASGIGTLAKDSNLLDYDVHTFLTLWSQGDRDKNPREIKLKVEKSRTASPGEESLWFDGAGQFFRPAAASRYEEFDAFSGESRT